MSKQYRPSRESCEHVLERDGGMSPFSRQCIDDGHFTSQQADEAWRLYESRLGLNAPNPVQFVGRSAWPEPQLQGYDLKLDVDRGHINGRVTVNLEHGQAAAANTYSIQGGFDPLDREFDVDPGQKEWIPFQISQESGSVPYPLRAEMSLFGNYNGIIRLASDSKTVGRFVFSLRQPQAQQGHVGLKNDAAPQARPLGTLF